MSVTDELRMKGEEPILRFDDFWVLATTQMIEEYGKPFRDILEFRQACNFLHENGNICSCNGKVLVFHRLIFFINEKHVIIIKQSTYGFSK